MDQRRFDEARLILEHFGFEETCKGLVFNGDKEGIEEQLESEPLDKEETTVFRELAALLNYLSSDCPDLKFPTKQCSRDMSSPTRGSWKNQEDGEVSFKQKEYNLGIVMARKTQACVCCC